MNTSSMNKGLGHSEKIDSAGAIRTDQGDVMRENSTLDSAGDGPLLDTAETDAVDKKVV